MSARELSVESNTVDEINAVLGRIASEFAKRPLSSAASGYTASVAGDQFTVTHSLGYTPDRVLHDVTDEMIVWATAEDRALWTSTQVVLRANVTDAVVYVKLERD